MRSFNVKVSKHNGEALFWQESTPGIFDTIDRLTSFAPFDRLGRMLRFGSS
jgi:hypothetical protein